MTVAARLAPVLDVTETAAEPAPVRPGPTLTQAVPLCVVHAQSADVTTSTVAVLADWVNDRDAGLTA